MTESAPPSPKQPLRQLRRAITLTALIIALAHIVVPTLGIDAITLALLGIALVPWLAPLFKSLEFPGGWKVEFQALEQAAARADAAGLLAPKDAAPQPEFAFQRAAAEDPNLALAGLRIEIERRLLKLAQARGLDPRNRGVGVLLRDLATAGVLGQSERSVLTDMVGLLNSAVHGAVVDERSADWAIRVGPRLLKTLDDLATQSG